MWTCSLLRVSTSIKLLVFGCSDIHNTMHVAAVQAVHKLLTQRQAALNMYGLSIKQIMTLINECLNCSNFRWSGQHYRELRGLAMGQRLAPTLAIVSMSKIKEPV
ncbi:hypothetical protein RB195_023763 [Necator americanus]|uniref:Integrase zinc-binding domain-containing protein n=1 Tax=Necator americanus TaxID=51031 RepID=A0ABR1EMP8_NECAM